MGSDTRGLPVATQQIGLAHDERGTGGFRSMVAKQLWINAASRQCTGQNHKISGTPRMIRSEEHTSELQSLMRISYAVFCLKKKKIIEKQMHTTNNLMYKHNTTSIQYHTTKCYYMRS